MITVDCAVRVLREITCSVTSGGTATVIHYADADGNAAIEDNRYFKEMFEDLVED
jgi:hypothetical protein|tara:strand:- start:447 stop:611 length:165 start_codon:yes stop_codon:yes gene_type:complete